jgi:hypothetical protein
VFRDPRAYDFTRDQIGICTIVKRVSRSASKCFTTPDEAQTLWNIAATNTAGVKDNIKALLKLELWRRGPAEEAKELQPYTLANPYEKRFTVIVSANIV